MDAPDTNEMSADQVQELSKELAKIRGACIVIGIATGILASAMTAFGVLSYQQGSLQRDTLSRLVQRVEDFPRPNGDQSAAILVNTERISTLQKQQSSDEERMNLQGSVMNTLQQKEDVLERRIELLEKSK